MKDKWLMIGIVATFGAFFLMMVSMMSLSRHTAKNKELLARAPSTPQQTQTVPTATADFSLYKTVVGDDGREMVEIPEGPFKMGSSDGDYDEAPEHQVYLTTFYIDKCMGQDAGPWSGDALSARDGVHLGHGPHGFYPILRTVGMARPRDHA